MRKNPHRSACPGMERWMWVLISMMMIAGGTESAEAGSLRRDGRLEFLTGEGMISAAVDIQVADTPQERARGLMGFKKLDESEGMLFIYPDADLRAFWMRNTYVSLDIIFLSEGRRVINIAQGTRVLSDTRYYSEEPAQYVVEVIAGFCQAHGIRPGDSVRWRLQ